MEISGLLLWMYLLAASLVNLTLSLADDCAVGCTCSPISTSRRHQSWLLSQSSHRLQRMFTSERRRHPQSYPSEKDPTRKMICIGLDQMPSFIPPDVRRLTIYGDAERPVYKSRASFTGHIDWDRLVDLTASEQIVKNHNNQMTRVTKSDLSQATQLDELSIEGNHMTSLTTGLFKAMQSLKKLSFRENGIENIPPHILNGLENVEVIDLSKNNLLFLSDMSSINLPKLKSLHLQHNQLEDLYGTDFSFAQELEGLDLSHNKIEYLDFRIFEPLTELQKLNLASNGIRGVVQSWFDANSNLRWLSLANNNIELIEGGSFSKLELLEHLDLSRNNIGSIDPPMFTGLSSLDLLDLSNNNLAMIDGGTFMSVFKLRELNLARNIINNLDKSTFDGLQMLHSLDLSENNIHQLNNTDFVMLWNLTSLDLSHNRINTIMTGTFQNMQSLREIHLNDNAIREVQDKAFSVSEITSLSQLGWLILDNNKIERISENTLAGLPFLRYLGLSKNRLESIDKDAFYHSTNLVTLDLEHNLIPQIQQGSFKALSSLVKLNLGSNMLSTIQPNTFFGLDSLVDLFLNDNMINSISPGSFIPLISVRQLQMHNNALDWIDMSWLAGMFNLRYLDVSGNQLQEVVPAVGVPTALEELNLSNNELDGLEQTITQSLTTNGKINLVNNPWRCNCELAWLPAVHMRSQYRFANDSDVTCARPQHLFDKEVFSLTAHEFCNLEGDVLPTTLQLEIHTKPTPGKTTQVPTSLTTKATVTTTRVQKIATTTLHAADMPMGTLPAMPKLLCDNLHQNNRTFRGRKLLVSWHISVVNESDKEVLCTGARLDTNWFILSASCLVDRLDSKSLHTYLAVIGSNNFNSNKSKANNARVRSMQKVTIHPEFEGRAGTRYDIALVQLTPQLGSMPQLYNESPCIMSKGDLEQSIATFKVGRLTSSKSRTDDTEYAQIKIEHMKNRLAPKLCSSGKYMCSRFKQKQDELSNYNLIGAPIYVRHGIGDSDWALSALNTHKSRTSKKGGSIIHKHLPLYAHVNWFQHVMEQEARWLAQMH